MACLRFMDEHPASFSLAAIETLRKKYPKIKYYIEETTPEHIVIQDFALSVEEAHFKCAEATRITRLAGKQGTFLYYDVDLNLQKQFLKATETVNIEQYPEDVRGFKAVTTALWLRKARD